MDHFSSVQVRLCPPKVSREELLTINDFWCEMFLQARCPSSHPTNNKRWCRWRRYGMQQCQPAAVSPHSASGTDTHCTTAGTRPWRRHGHLPPWSGGCRRAPPENWPDTVCNVHGRRWVSDVYEICRLPRQFNGDCGHVSALRNGPYVGYEVKRNISWLAVINATKPGSVCLLS